jgi:hypothetical protein
MASNASQSTGSYFHGAHGDMHYFDQLPPSARQALANATFDWSSGSVLNHWKKARRGFKTGKDIAARVAEWDATQIAKDRKRVWGIEDHPRTKVRK